MNRILLQTKRRPILSVLSKARIQLRFCSSQVRKARKTRSSNESEALRKSKKRKVTRGVSETDDENTEIHCADDVEEKEPTRRTRSRAEQVSDEEPDPPQKEEKTRERFKHRRAQAVQGAHVADQIFDKMGDLAETEGASMKAMASFRMSMYVAGFPIYCISAYFNLFSGNFFIAWMLHKMVPMTVWSRINARQAENFLARHPALKRCKFSMKLPDSFRQDPQEHHDLVRSTAGRPVSEHSERMSAVFAQRKAMLKNHIKYGIAYDMADNQRALLTVPAIFLGTHFLDVQGILQTWGVWYDPALQWIIPFAGASYICRFIAPAGFGRAVKHVHDNQFQN